MNKEELGKLYPISVVKYNPLWPQKFTEEKQNLKKYFLQNLRIEHIGSTAVSGLSAKSTIDILMEKPENKSDPQIIKIFEENEYIHMKEQENHLMFVKGYSPAGLEDISFHVHMGPLDQNWLWDRINFRDYLNNHEDEKQRYQKLKFKLAGEFKHDREAYTDGKTEYIQRITEKAKELYESSQ